NSATQVIYTVTPDANTCIGLPVNYTITINPLPNVMVPALQTICTGVTANAVNLTSSTPNTTFSWTSTAGPNINGNFLTGTGNIPAQTLTNSGTKPDTVIYTITTSAAGCKGRDTTYMIIVSPKPTIVIPG